MNGKIANILKQLLEPLAFVDTLAGLVDTVEVANENKSVDKYPVSRDVTHNDCLNGRYKDLIPDSKKKSVIYFEDGGINLNGKKGKNLQYSSQLVLVGWLNLKKLGNIDYDTTSVVVASIIKSLNVPRFNDGVYQRVKIDVLEQFNKNKSIFGKYTYRDSQQYLLFPYDYFALKVGIEFEINTDCIDDYVPGTEDDCLNC